MILMGDLIRYKKTYDNIYKNLHLSVDELDTYLRLTNLRLIFYNCKYIDTKP